MAKKKQKRANVADWPPNPPTRPSQRTTIPVEDDLLEPPVPTMDDTGQLDAKPYDLTEAERGTGRA